VERITESRGIHTFQMLTGDEFTDLWESILVPGEIKQSLACQALLNFTMRPQVSRTVIPMHGVILLVGPPGTGKTSLAKGLASITAGAMKTKKLAYIEVEPHSLASSAHGKTQRAVMELFGGAIAECAASGPTFVLLDEVETLVADRAKLSFDANPVDVHRATDAALVQLDHLAEAFPNLLMVATSNFPQAIDSAFVSRCDLVLSIPLPGKEACFEILSATIRGLAQTFPAVSRLLKGNALRDVGESCVGLDGRQIRKMVAAACTFSREVALDPNQLTMEHLRLAAERSSYQKREAVSV
jgi:pachytene checkpoint protein 2